MYKYIKQGNHKSETIQASEDYCYVQCCTNLQGAGMGALALVAKFLQGDIFRNKNMTFLVVGTALAMLLTNVSTM